MYTYQQLTEEVGFLSRCGVTTGSIGKSLDGRDIPYIRVGNGAPCIVVTAGIHAREHIGCYLAVRQAEYALNHSAAFAPSGSIYFVPMVNPDGNELILKGVNALKHADRTFAASLLRGHDRRLLKANARGVDLNVNFDAGWGTGQCNTRVPGMENYIGSAPFSEPETRALRDFTVQVKPAATVSYHAIGRELYWQYGQRGLDKTRDYEIACYLNERLGYQLLHDDGTSAGGYKDWCIAQFAIPAFTIELVSDDHTHPFTDYALAKEDIARNVDLPVRLLNRLRTKA